MVIRPQPSDVREWLIDSESAVRERRRERQFCPSLCLPVSTHSSRLGTDFRFSGADGPLSRSECAKRAELPRRIDAAGWTVGWETVALQGAEMKRNEQLPGTSTEGTA
jgi:hypothetical protein